jgi:hypothetical protein
MERSTYLGPRAYVMVSLRHIPGEERRVKLTSVAHDGYPAPHHIGSGSQVVPALIDQVSSLTHFIRVCGCYNSFDEYEPTKEQQDQRHARKRKPQELPKLVITKTHGNIMLRGLYFRILGP